MMLDTDSFNELLVCHWRSLTKQLKCEDRLVTISGKSLELAAVVVFARYINRVLVARPI